MKNIRLIPFEVGVICKAFRNDKVGEQKIDIMVNLVTSDCKLAVYEVAREEGVQLV